MDYETSLLPKVFPLSVGVGIISFNHCIMATFN